MAVAPNRHWDIFCHVIDNFGDAGVCWRLAADLAGRGERVRLVIDDAAPLAFMAPQGAPGVEVMHWPGPRVPGDVVIEAFGCDPPPEHIAAMAARHPRPVWINLDYLSAEAYVERSHGLPSPQRNGLEKWFFFPGFTPRTGGLLREPELLAQRKGFDRDRWLASQGITCLRGERLVSLFCYDSPALPSLIQDLARTPTLLLVARGSAQVDDTPPGLRLHCLRWLSQTDYDRLLWACDLNFVRGEDSLVRALWAGSPFVWQIYPQHDAVHLAKLEAMLARSALRADTAALWRAWNGAAAWPGLPPLASWQQASVRWRSAQLEQADLVSQLLVFVRGKQGAGC
jgi:uncharacterized repeat protein (TIGR03837 family)